jgi:hypothetical protein
MKEWAVAAVACVFIVTAGRVCETYIKQPPPPQPKIVKPLTFEERFDPMKAHESDDGADWFSTYYDRTTGKVFQWSQKNAWQELGEAPLAPK